MTIAYDAQEMGTIKTLMSVRGTMLPLVFLQPTFWVLIFVHNAMLGLRCTLERSPDGELVAAFNIPKMDWRAVSAVTSLLTFFIVFYGSQSYGRMQKFFGHCVGLGGTCMNWVALVKITFPADKDQQWNATRLILASMHIQYYTLNESEGGAAISEQEWHYITERNLLTKDEIALLKDYKGYKPFLPLIWAMAEVEAALLTDPETGTTVDAKDLNARFSVSDLLSNFRELAFTFRGHCGQITNWLNQPVPFPYFHVLTALLILDLLLISYAFVTMMFHAAITSCIYFVICTIFLGLKEVAVAMSNPFGDDAIDFDLEKMLAGAFKNSVAILKDQHIVAGGQLHGLTNPVTSKEARFTIDASKYEERVPSFFPKTSSAKMRTSKMEMRNSKMSSDNVTLNVAQTDNV